MSDYRPGALAQPVASHMDDYAEVWGFGLPFETHVAGGVSAFLDRKDSDRDLFRSKRRSRQNAQQAARRACQSEPRKAKRASRASLASWRARSLHDARFAHHRHARGWPPAARATVVQEEAVAADLLWSGRCPRALRCATRARRHRRPAARRPNPRPCRAASNRCRARSAGRRAAPGRRPAQSRLWDGGTPHSRTRRRPACLPAPADLRECAGPGPPDCRNSQITGIEGDRIQ